MEFSIVHEVPGRLRVRLAAPVPLADLDLLTSVASNAPHANKATVYPRIGSVVICYDAAPGAREDVVSYLAGIDAAAIDRARTECSVAIAPRTNSLFIQIAELVGFHFARRWFCRLPFRHCGRSGATGAFSGRRCAPLAVPGWTSRCLTRRQSACRFSSGIPRRRPRPCSCSISGERLKITRAPDRKTSSSIRCLPCRSRRSLSMETKSERFLRPI